MQLETICHTELAFAERRRSIEVFFVTLYKKT